MIRLYENIKKRRQELEMTQTELALKVGYADKSMIAKIEAGKVNLTQPKIIAFANALCVSPGDLMGWDPVDECTALFERLDDIDQAKIIERMETMLEADKYQGKDASKSTA